MDDNTLSITGTIVAIQENTQTSEQLVKLVPSGADYCPIERSCTSEDLSLASGALGVGVTVIERRRIKRIEMKPNVKRLKSFNCHHNHVKDTKDLALAGFYCTGKGDCVRCFYCGGGLRNWLQEDDVWVEHAKWFPKCGYVLEQMGQCFVDTVQALKYTRDQISLQEVESLIDGRQARRPRTTRCNDCNERVIEVTFYPCGHMACYQCAHIDRSRPCHVCRRAVARRVQTILHT